MIDHPALVPASIYRLSEILADHHQIGVAEICPDFADGLLLSQEYGVPLEMELNCLVVEGVRGEEKRYAAIVLPYGKRANTGSMVKQQLDAKKVSFAPLDYVLETTGMEFGSITPLGLPDDWLVLVDSSIAEKDRVIVGGGFVRSKIMLPTALLLSLPNMVLLDGLAKD